MKIETKELTPELWNDLEMLFGSKGACGGCWCMSWRLEKGEKWNEVKGPAAKRRLEAGINAGEINGILAYSEGEPIGWCTFGPRRDFPRLNRAPSFKCDDADQVWSVPCFYVVARARGQGVARALLRHAVSVMKGRRVRTIEGYPSKPGADGKYIASFSWTGTHALFLKEGFEIVGNKDGGKQRVRMPLEGAGPDL